MIPKKSDMTTDLGEVDVPGACVRQLQQFRAS
jgi:hypothetical protein